jgi:hypothetical protein
MFSDLRFKISSSGKFTKPYFYFIYINIMWNLSIIQQTAFCYFVELNKIKLSSQLNVAKVKTYIDWKHDFWKFYKHGWVIFSKLKQKLAVKHYVDVTSELLKHINEKYLEKTIWKVVLSINKYLKSQCFEWESFFSVLLERQEIKQIKHEILL